MIFTSTMAADILFYSLCEWALYANEKYIDQLGGIQKWLQHFRYFIGDQLLGVFILF